MPIPWIRIEDLPLWESNELLSRAAGAPSQVLVGAERAVRVVLIHPIQRGLGQGASTTPYAGPQHDWHGEIPCAVHPATGTAEGATTCERLLRRMPVERSSCISSAIVIQLVPVLGSGVRPKHA